MSWKTYEKQVHRHFVEKYPDEQILFDQKLVGRHSKVDRQVDVLVRSHATGRELIGVFDCKHFSRHVDVRVIDFMVGFLDDLGANYGGVVSSRGFTVAARNRALSNGQIDLRVVPFVSPETVVDSFLPSLDFSDPRNSGYAALL
jgi:hypothetical protein